MKARRILPLLLVLAMLITTFASCGNDKPAETTPETKAETTAETVKETAAETVPETKPEETKAETLPETKSEETEAPETKAPETEAPETKAPETKAPETKAPETKAPETKAPETKAPETKAPETKAPVETIIPNDDKTIKVPTMNTKLTGAPEVDMTRPTVGGKVIYVKAGASGGDGSEAKPFASLGEAIASLKKLSPDKSRTVTIVLASGEYFVDETIKIDSSYQNCAGTINILCPDKNPATLGAWKKITGWSQTKVNGVNAFVADLPSGLDPHVFFAADGTRLARPKLPESGYYLNTGIPGYDKGLQRADPWMLTNDRALTYTPGTIPQFSNIEKTNVFMLHYWSCEVLSIQSIDYNKGEIYFNEKASMGMLDSANKGARFFIDNVFEALNEPGEVYADTKSGKIYYVPKAGESAASFSLYAGNLETMIDIDGYTPAKLLTFANINFVGADFDGKGVNRIITGAPGMTGMITINKSKNLRFYDCNFKHTGSWAVSLNESVSNVVFDACDLTDLGAGGFDFEGGTHGTVAYSTEACSQITVSNCTIAHYGRVYIGAVGIMARSFTRSTITHNEIYDGYYDGISLGAVLNFDTSNRQHVTRFNLISYNHIHDIGQGLLSDLGGIYTMGAQSDTYFINNLIHDITHLSYGYGGWGIYLDEGSSFMVFKNNISYNTSEQPFRIHYGEGNIADNNIFAFGGNGAFDVGRSYQATLLQTEQSVQLTHNILVTQRQPIYSHEPEFYWMSDSTNLVWDYSGKIGCGTGRKYTVEKMKAAGLFKNVGVADPLFADPFNGNFTLSPDSPAFKMGFKAIDMSTVGPQK